jgi:hypothetical protein
MNMREVVIFDKSANETMEMVHKLRTSGLIQGTDFDFKFTPAKYDNFSGSPIELRHTIFYFYKEKYATFYELKWA